MSIQRPIADDQVPLPKSEEEPIDINKRFPKMKPVNTSPTLFTLNGCGLTVYGSRNSDALTGTYVTTRYICAVFIPILPLDSYRVADAGNGGWYFIGKEKLGSFTKFWQRSVLGCFIYIMGSLMWHSYTDSPDYRANKANKHAQELVEQGRALEAADVYQSMIYNNLADQAPTELAISKLLRAEITSGDSKRCVAALRYIDKQQVSKNGRRAGLSDLADLTIAAAAKFNDPVIAESILSAFKPTPDELVRIHEARKLVLEKLHSLKPDEIEVRINLALLREELGEFDGALELLEPTKENLGTGEGARLYGHLLMEVGRETEALPHLDRYVTPRASALKSAEVAIDRVYENARNRVLNVLNQSGGPPGFMQKYENASENEQIQMVETYLAEMVERDQQFLTARKRYQEAAEILPSIMELGVAHLRIAQSETDPAKRSESLKKSESAFLMMSGSAGDTDEYRYFLGQVYFWSGREEDGRKLFDELLESNQRNPNTLTSLSEVYRKLGEENTARKLLEEAYEKSTDDTEKSVILRSRSILARTTDEKIELLSKAASDDPNIMIDLAQARAEKAEQSGNAIAAAGYYREALAGYDKLGRSSTVLNNSAILYGALFRVEGKIEDFENAARLMSEALEMQPANSILTYNTATTLMSVAILRIAKDRVHPKLLQFSSDIDLLRFLYQNESEKRELANQLAADPNFRKSISRFWEALLLAPKNTDIYSWGASVFYFIDDKESLSRLQQKAAEQEFDFSDDIEQYAKYLKHERDAELLEALKGNRLRIGKLVASIDEPKAHAMAQVYQAGSRLGGFSMGEATGVEDWIKDLKAALESAPCSSLRSAYGVSLEMLALEKLAKADPECGEFINFNRRYLEASDVLRILIRSKGELGEKVRKHPAVIEAREIAVIQKQYFPKSIGMRSWLILDGFKPEFDAAFTELVKQDEAEYLVNSIKMEIHFDSPSILIDKFWKKCLDGDEAAARDVHTKLIAAGVKMPDMF